MVAFGVVAALSLGSPAWADHTSDHTIAQMTTHYRDPALEPQNKPFALLYLRTTEGTRGRQGDQRPCEQRPGVHDRGHGGAQEQLT